MKSFIAALAMVLFGVILPCRILQAQPPPGQAARPPGGPGGNKKPLAIISGTVYLSQEDENLPEEPGPGVAVTVIGKRASTARLDTLYAQTDVNGRFTVMGLAPGDVFIRFTMLGYEEQSKAMKLSPGPNKVLVNLNVRKETLDAAVKEESVNTVSVKGDTIIFHAAAVKVNKGENAIDILEQMPGVEVTTSSVTVLGETVQNVYIDGALLFGNAPMRALTELPAEEVMTIKSYEEYANKDPHHKISKNESRQRVLDISTKSKSKGFLSVKALAGAGFDTDTSFHKFRYATGFQTNYSSETLQANVTVTLNNINDNTIKRRAASFGSSKGGGSADLRAADIAVSINRNWMSPTTRNFKTGGLGASYSYSDQYNVKESVSELVYFPTESYSSRSTESSSYSATGNRKHSFSLNGSKALRDGMLRASLDYNLSSDGTTSRSRMFNYQDELDPQGTASSTVSDSRAHSFSAGFSANKGFLNKIRFSAGVNYSESNSDGQSTKRDTTTSTITNTVLDIGTDALSRSFSISPTVQYELSDRSSISLGYSYNDSYSQTERLAFDITDPQMQKVDSVNTQLRTNANNTHNAALNFATAFGEDGSKVILNASLRFNSIGLGRSDAFPEEEPVYSRRFNSLCPALSVGNDSQINRWSFSWTSSDAAPSIEQMRPKINNTNLYSVSAGNPDLKQMHTNAFFLKYSTIFGKDVRSSMTEYDENDLMGGRGRERYINSNFVTFEARASFNVNRDVIVGKKTYFTEETYLPEYSYTMPAQSTFSSYENADASYSASLSLNSGIPVNPIKCILNVGLSMGWDSSPSYINSVLTTVRNYRPVLSLGLRSNISRNLRFNLNGNCSYVHSENGSNGDTDYFTESIRAGIDVNNILKVLYAGANYTKTFMQGIPYTSISDNILDLRGGVRFGPRNNYDLSLNVHDLFNRTSGFSTSMAADHVTNKWTHNFGRYVMFRFVVNFTSLRGGANGHMQH
ncbi:MAG: outer membrane beta-barrel protein [Candidatus Cryptobacteroides sp.]